MHSLLPIIVFGNYYLLLTWEMCAVRIRAYLIILIDEGKNDVLRRV